MNLVQRVDVTCPHVRCRKCCFGMENACTHLVVLMKLLVDSYCLVPGVSGIFFKKANGATTFSIARTKVSCSCPDTCSIGIFITKTVDVTTFSIAKATVSCSCGHENQ